MSLDVPVPLAGGLTVELFAVPGKVPLFLENGEDAPPIETGETTVAAVVSDGLQRLFFIPGWVGANPPANQQHSAGRQSEARRGEPVGDIGTERKRA